MENKIEKETVPVGKRYYGIDIFRMGMALVVLTSHIRPWQDWGNTFMDKKIPIFGALAVCYFFICSGYFIMGNREFSSDVSKLRTKFWKTLRLYVIWSAIYLPITLYGEVVIYQSGITRGIVNVLSGWVLRGENYNSWQLWYLLALSVTYLFIWQMSKRQWSINKMFFISVITFLLGRMIEYVESLHISEWNSLFYQMVGTRNGIFTGAFFVFLGIKLRSSSIKKLPLRMVFIFSIVSLIFSLVFSESIILSYIGIIFSSIGIFNISIRMPNKWISHVGFRNLGLYSKVIYLTHMYFYTIFSLVVNMNTSFYYTKAFLFSLSCALITGFLVKYIKKHRTISLGIF